MNKHLADQHVSARVGANAQAKYKVLVDALIGVERAYAEALDRLIVFAEESGTDEQVADARSLQEAIELVRCLRRLLPVQTLAEIHKAFGAPGDFGYETPIGDALARLYRGET